MSIFECAYTSYRTDSIANSFTNMYGQSYLCWPFVCTWNSYMLYPYLCLFLTLSHVYVIQRKSKFETGLLDSW